MQLRKQHIATYKEEAEGKEVVDQYFLTTEEMEVLELIMDCFAPLKKTTLQMCSKETSSLAFNHSALHFLNLKLKGMVDGAVENVAAIKEHATPDTKSLQEMTLGALHVELNNEDEEDFNLGKEWQELEFEQRKEQEEDDVSGQSEKDDEAGNGKVS